MRRYYQVAALLALALAVFVLVESRTGLNYYTEYGPGPGFLPFWCGVLLAGSPPRGSSRSLSERLEAPPEGFVPPRAALIRLGSVTLALLAFAASHGRGRLPAHDARVPLVPSPARRRPEAPDRILARFAGSAALTHLFRSRLDVPLPLSSLEFLRNLGL